MGGTYRLMGEMRNAYRILDGKPEGKRSLARLWRRREGNIKTDIREIWTERVDLIHVTRRGDLRRALANTVMKLHVP
jgi:hypothetical protein